MGSATYVCEYEVNMEKRVECWVETSMLGLHSRAMTVT